MTWYSNTFIQLEKSFSILTIKGIRLLSKKISLFLRFRKYKVKEEKEKKDFKDFIVTQKGKEKGIIIRVVYRTHLSSGKVGVQTIRKMKKTMKDALYEKGIIIGQSFSHSAKNESKRNNIETINEEVIPSFDVFKHDLVPKHEILDKEGMKELQKKYYIAPYMLPQIKSDDPISILIGAKLGDILKITRKSPTAGVHITYKYVA